MGLIGIKGKTNNNRRYPGESNRNRPDRAAARREEAQERQGISNGLTPQEKLIKLDMKFGKDEGAKKERAQLQAIIQNGGKAIVTKPASKVDAAIEALETATLPPEVMAEIEAMNENEALNKKKLKAKDRRARDKKVGTTII